MSYSLSHLATQIPGAQLVGASTEVHGVANDSRIVKPGDIFAAMKGSRLDGHDFAHEARDNGATSLIVTRRLPIDLPQLVVPSVRRVLGTVSSLVHGVPSASMSVVGITGTNGKTTTAYMIENALEHAGIRSGLIGTIETKIGGQSVPALFTTPEAPSLQSSLAEMVRHNVEIAVMEVSSHGIDQHRIDGTQFELGIFTNLAAEHLDYHGTIEQYFATKAQLFETSRCKKALICIDDEWGLRLSHQTQIPFVTYGTSTLADYQIIDVVVTHTGTSFTLKGPDVDVKIFSPIVGACNSQNAAAAFLALHLLGLDTEAAVSGIKSCQKVSGRFQRIELGQPIEIIIDYAHTPGAITSLIETARLLAPLGSEVYIVAGARGGRDRLKRPELGRALATANHVILTIDSPGDEDPIAIVEQLIAGTIDAPEGRISIELDREKAIRLAISSASPNDTVLIVGRGHEKSLRIGSHKIMFDDVEVARKAVETMGLVRPANPQLSVYATN
ncbi:MAG: UDP-N-acetylmuramoyl-L-alanyl-D-glutamate--2,6-diaminopimelate ligase [Acidimicrobiaceae bacterium]|nr:UDP-N-acetylmuramoyl-L-alanyl-D-glutamate--2,6-diaminopimelate ligase [Acidimicrobiaceae bacterium]